MHYNPYLLFIILMSFTACVSQQKAYHKTIKIHRDTYLNAFRNNPQGPVTPENISKINFFPPNFNYKVSAVFTRTPEEKPFEMPTSSGVMKQYVQYGIAHFDLNGNSFELAIYQSIQLRQNPIYKDYLFLPFKDKTNGTTTYSGGRYLDLKLNDIINGKITLDFNKAYNPYCAYTDGYSCPIPPATNHLTVDINAGEKNYLKE